MKCVSLFSGIGGFDLAMTNLGHEIVGACEIDGPARTIYARHFPKVKLWQDATKLDPKDLPGHDILMAGFPCQAFSVAGKRLGFQECRGTLFYEIIRVVKETRPSIIFLENVMGLLNHDKARTIIQIISSLDEVGYDVEWQVTNSKFHVPQNRERIYIVGHLRGSGSRKIFPITDSNGQDNGKSTDKERMVSHSIDANYFKGPDKHAQRTIIQTEPKIKRVKGKPNVYNTDAQAGKIYEINGISPTISGQRDNSQGFIVVDEPKLKTVIGSDINTNRVYDPSGIARTLRASNKTGVYAVENPLFPNKVKNGSRIKTHDEPSFTLQSNPAFVQGVIVNKRLRKLTPTECERLQGFPDSWTEGQSDTQRYKQLGNAVTVPMVQVIAERFKIE